MELFHVTGIGKYYCKNMKYRINCHICIFSSPIFHLGLQFGDIPPFSVGEGDLINAGGGKT